MDCLPYTVAVSLRSDLGDGEWQTLCLEYSLRLNVIVSPTDVGIMVCDRVHSLISDVESDLVHVHESKYVNF